jgi:hypothetical protein
MRLLFSPVSVSFAGVIQAIDAFNKAGRNQFGPNVPVKSHSPLLFKIEGINLEFEFYASHRSPEAGAFLKRHPTFLTRHVVIYPMTRALIARQWHRVYAFDVRRKEVVDVKLLVARTSDPELFLKFSRPSAWPWIMDARDTKEPLIFLERRRSVTDQARATAHHNATSWPALPRGERVTRLPEPSLVAPPAGRAVRPPERLDHGAPSA